MEGTSRRFKFRREREGSKREGEEKTRATRRKLTILLPTHKSPPSLPRSPRKRDFSVALTINAHYTVDRACAPASTYSPLHRRIGMGIDPPPPRIRSVTLPARKHNAWLDIPANLFLFSLSLVAVAVRPVSGSSVALTLSLFILASASVVALKARSSASVFVFKSSTPCVPSGE
ncbi:hypothetical protein K443DRAFT_683888 [Laccaria amethystina LaAM-08-1]|uniref:Uncharacterized protein n=1 Tax=Laccaria amethystina LaAM-08-1 TaxID=1095629 RepID=A0A0C9WRZ9_9AGAR|nr:hypothetical protein K443DRAFT_683888 [Laccaria amethystina LaAM-08-1]